jgi:hypothetical protein
VITFFTIPKAFAGRSDWIQRNAVGSWMRVVPGAQVILFGDDPGVEEAAESLGVEHVAGIERTEAGTPRLDGAFAEVRAEARHPLLCFLNADIVLLDDFHAAAARIAGLSPPLLVVGETWDTEITGPLDFDSDWQARVRTLARAGYRRGAGALDYFLYTRDVYEQLPPFAVGRVGFDNWLVWEARARGARVIDATPSVRAVHQRHDYSHVAGGRAATRIGSEEADRNLRLVGAKSRLYTRYDATHVLGRRRLRRNLLAAFRLKENLRKALYKTRTHTPWPPRDRVQAQG